jgi:type VI secretion system lysozyme-like protein
MFEPRVKPGAWAPLFERLVDLEPMASSEPQPLRLLERSGLRESVRQELTRLFNTRCARLTHRPRTVLDYGLPDPTHYAARNPEHQRALARDIAQAIAAFEPRLRKVRVRVRPPDRQPTSLVFDIEAVLVTNELMEPVAFSTMMDQDSGLTEVNER